MVHASTDRRKVDTQVHQPDDLAPRSPLTASAQTQEAWRKRDEGRQPSDGNDMPHRNLSIPYFARDAVRGEYAAKYLRAVRQRFVRDHDRRRAHSEPKPKSRESAA